MSALTEGQQKFLQGMAIRDLQAERDVTLGEVQSRHGEPPDLHKTRQGTLASEGCIGMLGIARQVVVRPSPPLTLVSSWPGESPTGQPTTTTIDQVFRTMQSGWPYRYPQTPPPGCRLPVLTTSQFFVAAEQPRPFTYLPHPPPSPRPLPIRTPGPEQDPAPSQDGGPAKDASNAFEPAQAGSQIQHTSQP